MKLTLEYLKKHKVCQEGVDFAIRNNLIGFPLDSLSEVQGDFHKFVGWLKARPVLEFDDRGNLIKQTCANGNIIAFEYDERGNMTKKTFPNGDVSTYEYDERGNMIKQTYPSGRVDTWEFIFKNDHLHQVKKNDKVVSEIPTDW